MEPLIPGSIIARMLKRLTAQWRKHGTIITDSEDEMDSWESLETEVSTAKAAIVNGNGEGMKAGLSLGQLLAAWNAVQELIAFYRSHATDIQAAIDLVRKIIDSLKATFAPDGGSVV